MGRRWLCLPLCILLLVSIVRTTDAQTPSVQLRAEPFFDGKHHPGSWLPFRITIANAGKDITARVQVQTGAIFETSIDLPHGANKSLLIYTRPEAAFRSTAVTRVIVGSTEVARVETPLAPVNNRSQLVGVLAAQPISLPVASSELLQAESVPLSLDDLPDRGEGLSSLDILVVDGAPLAELTPQQATALADWVRTGGQLIVGGTRVAATLEQLPDVLRIATVDGTTQGGAVSLLPEIDQPIFASRLVAADGAYPIATIDADLVGVQHVVGRGYVTVVGFSLSEPQLAALPPDAQFWQVVVNQTAPPMSAMGPEVRAEDAQLEQLSFALMQLPALAMPPLTTLAALLGLYLLLVGPGMYLLLRRLERQVLGWIMIPVVTLAFTAGTYGYGLYLRGDDVILNQISVLEPSAGRTFIRTAAGIFSPTPASYTLSGAEQALFRPLRNSFAPAPTGGNASLKDRYMQQPSGVADLQVAQWSMSTFAAEEMRDGAPLAAEIRLEGDTLRGSVRNTGTEPIRGVALVQGRRVVKIGDIQPGEAKPVEFKLEAQPHNDWGMPLSMQLLPDVWNQPQPQAIPVDVRMQQAVLDSLMGGPFPASTEPMVLGWLDQTPLTFEVDRGRVQHQQLALITMPLTIDYEVGQTLSLPRGWIIPTYTTNFRGGGTCGNQWGPGWYLESGVLTSVFQLPPSLRAYSPAQATLYVNIDNVQLDGMQVSIYDWSAGEWGAVDTREVAAGLALDGSTEAFGPAGKLMVQVDIGSSSMHGGGCVTTDLSIDGGQS